MIDMSPIIATIVMTIAVIIAVFVGFPLAFSIGGIALLIGFFTWGSSFLSTIYYALWGVATNYIFLAAPLFIFMGNMIGRSGVADKLFGALYLWMGGLRGGLAMAVIVLGTALAACVGIIGASVSMLGIIALPAMLQRGYSKSLACGAVCAGGTLGILIPPSIMLVIYGPTASISVGKLFMGAFLPGLLLSSLYITYIAMRSFIQKDIGPSIPSEDRAAPLGTKVKLLFTSLFPLLFLIVAVLGSIFFGIAAPTEAAAVGALASIILTAAYKKLNWPVLKDTMYRTLLVGAYVIFFAAGAFTFTNVFLGLGCGHVVSDLIMSAPFGKWGAFATIMFIIFILGMFVDWIGIIFIIVPIITPIGAALGFDKLWFAMMVCVNLQMAFLSPPLAYAIFYLKGVTTPEMGISTMHIIRGVIPYIILIAIGITLMIIFPEVVTWLPKVSGKVSLN
ncbi:MAG TPA: TRAP transporter large permease subunit [Dehalococcoidia bacterium]|nr:TRAP transporter large permease subunit [Dehalococcoidia bacterium]